MKQWITLLSYFCYLFVYGECDGDFIVNQNSVFQQPVNVSNISLIKNLNCNGNISIGTTSENSSITINLQNSPKYPIPYKKKKYLTFGSSICLTNLPIIEPDSTIPYLIIDENNQIFQYINNSSELSQQTFDNNLTDNITLEGGIESRTINSNNTPLIFHSQNKLGNDIDIKIGNKNNNIIVLSSILCDINELIFNNSINYPLVCNQNVIINGQLSADSISINGNFGYSDLGTINFKNLFIHENITINTTTPTLIQGNVSWGNSINLGNFPQSSFFLYGFLDQNIGPSSFLVIDQNNTVYNTPIYPITSILQLNACKSDTNLTLLPQLNSAQNNVIIGNNTGNITFDTPSISFSNSITTANTTTQLSITDNFFISNIVIQNIDNLPTLIMNDNSTHINGNITTNNITINQEFYLKNLPVITNPIGYVGVLQLGQDPNQNIIGGLSTINQNLQDKRSSQLVTLEKNINYVHKTLDALIFRLTLCNKTAKKEYHQYRRNAREIAFLLKKINHTL